MGNNGLSAKPHRPVSVWCAKDLPQYCHVDTQFLRKPRESLAAGRDHAENIEKGNGSPGFGRHKNLIGEADGVGEGYIGGRGDDTYFVDHADDVIIEKNNDE